MENSILKTLPAELRLKIYAEVFEGTVITITVKVTRPGELNSQSHLHKYSFDRGCSLAVTCRAIKAESEEIMWRSAIVKAENTSGYDINIHELNKALPDEVALYITHLANVTFLGLGHAQSLGCESATTSLLKYPNLQVFDTPYLDCDDDFMIGHMYWWEYVEDWLLHDKVDRQIVPFSYERSNPIEFLEEYYGIKENIGIQIIGWLALDYPFTLEDFVVVCIAPLSSLVRRRRINNGS